MILFLISRDAFRREIDFSPASHQCINIIRLIIKLGLNKQCINIFNNFKYYDCFSFIT